MDYRVKINRDRIFHVPKKSIKVEYNVGSIRVTFDIVARGIRIVKKQCTVEIPIDHFDSGFAGLKLVVKTKKKKKHIKTVQLKNLQSGKVYKVTL